MELRINKEYSETTMLIYSRKKSSGFQSLQSTKTLLDLNITTSSLSDSSGIHSLTATNTSFNTAITKNGTASVRIPRSGRIYTNVPAAGNNLRIDADAWNFSSWVYLVSAGNHNIVGDLATSTFYPMLHLSGSIWYIGDGLVNKLIFSQNPPVNQWIHLNHSWDGTFYRIHQNGVLMSKSAASTPMKLLETAGWEIGTRTSQGVTSDIYLGSLEINRGFSRDDSTFTPNYMENMGQFAPAKHLSYADSNDFLISGDITIETILTWNGVVDSNGVCALWGQNPNTASNMRVSIVNTSGAITAYIDSDSNIIPSSINITAGVPTHIAYVKSGTTYSLYVNGALAGTKTGGATLTNATTPFFLGSEEGLAGYNFIGKMKEWAFTRAAKYTEAFTAPSTLDLTASNPFWDQTVRGINFANGVVDVKGNTITNSGVVIV